MDKLKIMVVDDESRMRKLVKDFLKKKDFEVIEAADGEEALDIFFGLACTLASALTTMHTRTRMQWGR